MAIRGDTQEQALYRCSGRGGFGLVRYEPASKKIRATPLAQTGGEQISQAYQLQNDVLIISAAGYVALYSSPSSLQKWRFEPEDAKAMEYLPATQQLIVVDSEHRLQVFDLPYRSGR